MAAANLAAYNAALKQTWTEDKLAEQLYQGSDTLNWVETTRRFRVGKEAVTPLHTSRNGGYTTLGGGGGNLNAAGKQGSKQAKWNYTHHHQQIGIEGETIDGTADDAIAVAEVVETEVTGGLNDLRRQLERQLWLAGDSIICVCGVTAAATTVNLEPVSGFDAIKAGWLYEGAVIDVGTVANPTLRGSVTVLDVVESETAPQIIVDAAITTAATDQISWKGSRVAGPASREMNGFRNMISTTAIVGQLDPATNSVWKAANVETSAQDLTLPLMLKQSRKIRQKGGRGETMVGTSFKQEEKYYLLLQMQARFDGDNDIAAGDVEKSKYAGMKVKGFIDCPDGDMVFVTKEHFFLCAAGKPYWQNKVTGDPKILDWIQGTDSYGAKLTYRLQPAMNRRNVHARLENLR